MKMKWMQISSQQKIYHINKWLLWDGSKKQLYQAREIETSPINLQKLEKIIPEIRLMTRIQPKEFCPSLIQMLTECGIALVFLPHIGGSFLHGATFCDGNKIVIGLTVRGKDADKFWFSLFHELAHILYGHIYQDEGTTDLDEEAANMLFHHR